MLKLSKQVATQWRNLLLTLILMLSSLTSYAITAQQYHLTMSQKDQQQIDSAIKEVSLGNYQQSLALLHPLAKKKNLIAQWILADLYLKKEGIKDNAKALYWYRKSAELGLDMAQYNLAMIYYNGEIVKKDNKKAIRWLTRAAEQGLDTAQYNLGRIYDTGNGIQQNHQLAIKWYLQAAEQGYVKAQFNLASIYLKQEDYSQAAKWFQEPAQQGIVDAQYVLGKLYEFGKGVPQNNKESVYWIEKAANQGMVRALMDMGEIYLEGTIIEKDLNKAKYYFSQACDKGFQFGCSIAKHLDRDVDIKDNTK